MAADAPVQCDIAIKPVQLNIFPDRMFKRPIRCDTAIAILKSPCVIADHTIEQEHTARAQGVEDAGYQPIVGQGIGATVRRVTQHLPKCGDCNTGGEFKCGDVLHPQIRPRRYGFGNGDRGRRNIDADGRVTSRVECSQQVPAIASQIEDCPVCHRLLLEKG